MIALFVGLIFLFHQPFALRALTQSNRPNITTLHATPRSRVRCCTRKKRLASFVEEGCFSIKKAHPSMDELKRHRILPLCIFITSAHIQRSGVTGSISYDQLSCGLRTTDCGLRDIAKALFCLSCPMQSSHESCWEYCTARRFNFSPPEDVKPRKSAGLLTYASSYFEPFPCKPPYKT